MNFFTIVTLLLSLWMHMKPVHSQGFNMSQLLNSLTDHLKLLQDFIDIFDGFSIANQQSLYQDDYKSLLAMYKYEGQVHGNSQATDTSDKASSPHAMEFYVANSDVGSKWTPIIKIKNESMAPKAYMFVAMEEVTVENSIVTITGNANITWIENSGTSKSRCPISFHIALYENATLLNPLSSFSQSIKKHRGLITLESQECRFSYAGILAPAELSMNLVNNTALIVLLHVIDALFCIIVIKIMKVKFAKRISLISLVSVATYQIGISMLVVAQFAYLRFYSFWFFLIPTMIVTILSAFMNHRMILYFKKANRQREKLMKKIHTVASLGFFVYAFLVNSVISSKWVLLQICLHPFPQIVKNIMEGKRLRWNYWVWYVLISYKLLYLLALPPYFSVSHTEFKLMLIMLVTSGIILALQQAINLLYPSRKRRIIVNANENTCSICLEALKEECPRPFLLFNFRQKKLLKTPCKHIFHAKCLREWKNTKHQCPNCRSNLGHDSDDSDFPVEE